MSKEQVVPANSLLAHKPRGNRNAWLIAADRVHLKLQLGIQIACPRHIVWFATNTEDDKLQSTVNGTLAIQFGLPLQSGFSGALIQNLKSRQKFTALRPKPAPVQAIQFLSSRSATTCRRKLIGKFRFDPIGIGFWLVGWLALPASRSSQHKGTT